MNKSKPALTGLFVMGALALAIIGLLVFGGLQWFEPSQKSVVYFEEKLGGLNVGAPVTFRGIEMGTVRQMRIQADPRAGRVLVRVLLQLRPGDINLADKEGATLDLDDLVEQGLRAQLRPRSLVTGQMAVELDFLPDTSARRYGREGDPPEIPALPSEIEQLRNTLMGFPWEETLETVVSTMDSLKSLSETLNSELTGVGDKLHRTLDDSRELIGESRQTLESLDQRSAATLENVDRLSSRGIDHLESRSQELEALLDSASVTLERVDGVAVRMEDLFHPRSQERDDLRRLLRDLSSSGNNLRRLTEKLEKQPSLLIFDQEEESP
ncbi:MAG: MlaD family protein [Oleiphilaceae bacterium]|nr:MlaD family protein [Oleiphilaceae bacterium]